MKRVLAVAGMTGAGKTTFVEALARELSRSTGEPFEASFEPHEGNPYLAGAYEDPARWSFAVQVHYLLQRIEQTRAALASPHSVVLDRTLSEGDEIFVPARVEFGWMTDAEAATYASLSAELTRGLSRPDLLVLLHRSPEKVREMISSRGRGFEQKVDDRFFRILERRYEEWFAAYPGRKLRMDADSLDFVNRPGDLLSVTDRIRRELLTL